MENAEQPASYTTRSLLIVDCGSVFTKVALLGVIENQYRLIGRAQAATTLTPPLADLAIGARDAIAILERIAGRTMLRDGQVITPEQADGSGVDGLALVTSVGGPMKLLAAGPGREALAASCIAPSVASSRRSRRCQTRTLRVMAARWNGNKRWSRCAPSRRRRC